MMDTWVKVTDKLPKENSVVFLWDGNWRMTMFDPSWNSAMQTISDEQARQAVEPLSDRLLRTYTQRNDAGFDVLLHEVKKLCDENVIMHESLKLARLTDARCEELQELLNDIEREYDQSDDADATLNVIAGWIEGRRVGR